MCYNYGTCMPITTDAQTVDEARRRPRLTAPGVVYVESGSVKSLQDIDNNNANARFTADLAAGDIVRIDGTTKKDVRVTEIVSDTEFKTDTLTDHLDASSAENYEVLKCAAGREDENGAVVPDEHALAYLSLIHI